MTRQHTAEVDTAVSDSTVSDSTVSDSTVSDATATAGSGDTAEPTGVSSRVSRRSLLRLAFGSGAVVAAGPLVSLPGLRVPGGVVAQGSVNGVISKDAPMKGPRVKKFAQELTVPPVAVPSEVRSETVAGVSGARVLYYDVEQREAEQQILPDGFPATPIFSYNGTYPGPTFRGKRNSDFVVVRNTNRLPHGHPTTTHLHGSPTQAAHDGHPDDLCWPAGDPGRPATSAFDGGPSYSGTHVYRYPNNEENRTLWYHDHAMHQTADHVYRGLVGMHIQTPSDEATAKFGLDRLPSGVPGDEFRYDVPLILADMQFDERGRVRYDDEGHDSLWGNVMVVNGRAWPRMTVDRTRYRFRVLGASVSRGFNLKLSRGSKGSPPPTMTMIGTDAGLLAEPVVVTSWRHGMAERYEVVIDFTNLEEGEKVTLVNTAGDDDMRQVMQFVAGPDVVPSEPVPDRLNDYVFGEAEAEAVNRRNPRHFRFERSGGQWVINDLPWDGRIAADPKLGTAEVWRFENKSGGWFHPIHVHLVDFHILRRNGRKPFPYERGWKDVAYVGPNETVDVAIRFHAPQHVDPSKPRTGKYVIHCHNLVHEDHDMMTQFETQPGTAAHAAHAADLRRQPSMMVQWELT